MQKNHITTQKTARYYQTSDITHETKTVIIACHGYGQLAEYFLKWFEGVEISNTVIIAPEGLHRFYWQGFNGKVVASWMTKEDRENDIKDYCYFIDSIIKKLSIDSNINLIGFGFSQGAATISRWAEQTQFKVKHLIHWAGVFPEDVPVDSINLKLNTPIEILFGDQDEFYSIQQLDELKVHLSKIGLNYNFTQFVGAHKIYLEPLNNLLKKINVT